MYVNIEFAMPRGEEGLEFSRVTTRLRDANRLPICTENDNLLLDTCIYEVECQDEHEGALTANTIVVNMFAQVDEEGHRHVLLDHIVDHHMQMEAKQKEKTVSLRLKMVVDIDEKLQKFGNYCLLGKMIVQL